MQPFPPPPVFCDEILTVGVTGTNGKSSTVHWVAAAMATLDPEVVCISTVSQSVGNERIAAPPTYQGFIDVMERGHRRGARHASIELTSAALAAGFMRGWRCRVGVFTNLSHDHLDMHGSAEHYLASKAQLFIALPEDGTAVLNRSDEASALLDEVIPPAVRRWTFGESIVDGVDLAPDRLRVDWEGTSAELVVSARLAPLFAGVNRLRIPAIGDIYLVNALGALLASVAAGVPARDAAAAMAKTPAPPGRFEVVAPRVVVDYAHTPAALERTLRIARPLCQGRLCLVLGAGGGRDREKRVPMGRIARAADRVILTSDNPRDEDAAHIASALREGLDDHPDVSLIVDRRAAIAAALERASPEDVVLVTGKGHETVQSTAAGEQPFSDAAVIRELHQRRMSM